VTIMVNVKATPNMGLGLYYWRRLRPRSGSFEEARAHTAETVDKGVLSGIQWNAKKRSSSCETWDL